MSAIYFVSDLHLGHKSVLRHTQLAGKGFRGGATVAEHDQWVIEQLQKVGPNKRTLWYIMGDVAMNIQQLALLNEVQGRKRFIMGNHDLFDTQEYLKYFEQILGGHRKYDMWITHIPVHPEELRNSPNIHGHCHQHNLVSDPRYLNVAIELLAQNLPMTLEQVRAYFSERN